MRLKYIIFDNAFPVVFGEYFKHSDMQISNGLKPTSAGFCIVKSENDDAKKHNKVICFGESTSLNLKSSPLDSKMVERLFNS